MESGAAATSARTLGLLGAISGAGAWLAVMVLDRLGIPAASDVGGLQLGPVTIVPGVAFGAIVGSRFLARSRLVAYVVASTAAYLLAYHVAYMLGAIMRLDTIVLLAIDGVVAGLCGSVLLAAFTIALRHVARSALRLSIVVGAAAGALLPFATMGDWGGLAVGPLVFFVIWQGAYAAALAHAARPVHTIG
jgi:hypothetical protein